MRLFFFTHTQSKATPAVLHGADSSPLRHSLREHTPMCCVNHFRRRYSSSVKAHTPLCCVNHSAEDIKGESFVPEGFLTHRSASERNHRLSSISAETLSHTPPEGQRYGLVWLTHCRSGWGQMMGGIDISSK